MSAAELGPTPERLSTTPESIFPLDVEMLTNRLKLFEASSDEMLRVVTEARGRWGKATDLYLNFPINDFVDWHKEARDFTPNGELHYRVGLLYGMDLAQHARSQHYVTNELVADDPDAYDQSLTYLKETYRKLDDTPKLNWIRQKNRELRYTGSDVLTLANATLQDGIFDKLGWRERRIKTEADLAEASQDISAMHTGLVDGAIFVNALHSYTRGAEPQIFEDPHEYAPTINFQTHHGHGLGSEDDEDGLIVRYELESGDLQGAIDGFTNEIEDVRVDFPAGDVGFFEKRFIQSTPNEFVRGLEIKKIGYKLLSRKMVGGAALTAVGMDVVRAVALDYHDGLTTVGVAGVLTAVTLRRRRRARKAAKDMGVPFVGRVKEPVQVD